MKKLPTLYHFTCEHGHTGIMRTCRLLPNVHPYMKHLGPLLWLTDLPEPTRESAGLTSNWTTCDRMAYRYIVRSKAAIHWPDLRLRAPKDVVEILESFGEPEHWWIARRPLTQSEFSFDTSWKCPVQVSPLQG
jgi:hypothetical protein